MAGPRLTYPRLQRRSSDDRAPLPLSAAAEAIRENLAERCQQLTELDPRAINLAAAALAELHEGCRGRQTELRGTSSPEHCRRTLLGRDALSVERQAYLALHAPEAVQGFLQVMARAVGMTLQPAEPDDSASVSAELARLVRAAGEMASGIVQRLEDGLTAEEAVEGDALVHELKGHVANLEAALHNAVMGSRR